MTQAPTIPSASRASTRRTQRGATMVSVMLLTVSMLTVGILVVRSADRQLQQASASAARDRALLSAQGAVDLATAQLRQSLFTNVNALDGMLAGNSADAPPQANTCTSATRSCIPGAGTSPKTGQKNTILTTRSSCAGRPCMRQGAVVRLPNSTNTTVVPWVDRPLSELIANGDPEARVSVWIRNNSADALGNRTDAAGAASWTNDTDSRVVITAMATVRNTTVAIEQEITVALGVAPSLWQMASPDEQYGGSHNNDNAAVEVCTDNYAKI